MTLLPVNPSDYPVSYPPMDESLTYKVMVTACDIADKVDKNGNNYIKATMEVVEPEAFAGDLITDNYIGLPPVIGPNMDEGERRKALKGGVRLAQFSKCFGVKGTADGMNTDEFLGKTGSITIKNEEYQGRKNSKPDKYLF